VRKLPWIGESCTIRADIDESYPDYVKARYDESNPRRTAIIPFDVPENFSPPGALPGSMTNHSGQELARRLQAALLSEHEMGIVEVFDRGSWQQKREEFFHGNYSSIEQSRAAGYDFVIVGMLEPITDGTTLRFQTKLIDTASNTTVFSGMTEIYANARDWDKALIRKETVIVRNDLFNFREKFETYARCTAKRLSGTDKDY
jgi:hypothetical protein